MVVDVPHHAMVSRQFSPPLPCYLKFGRHRVRTQAHDHASLHAHTTVRPPAARKSYRGESTPNIFPIAKVTLRLEPRSIELTRGTPTRRIDAESDEIPLSQGKRHLRPIFRRRSKTRRQMVMQQMDSMHRETQRKINLKP